MKQFIFGAFLLSLAYTPSAFALEHDYVMSHRSSDMTHVYVSQGVEGEFSRYALTGVKLVDTDSPADTRIVDAKTGQQVRSWQGYGFNTVIGMEVLKFLQFNVSHTFLNMRATSSGLERLTGSRLGGGMKMIFAAPIGNLEIGGGAVADRYDYQKNLETANLYGSGYYYSFGVNYFLNTQVSVYGTVKMVSEHLVRNGGSDAVRDINVDATNMGVGFSLWL